MMTTEQFTQLLGAIEKIATRPYALTGAVDWPLLLVLGGLLMAVIGAMWVDFKQAMKDGREEWLNEMRDAKSENDKAMISFGRLCVTVNPTVARAKQEEAMTDNEKAFLAMLAWAELGQQIIAVSSYGYNVLVESLPGRVKLFHDYSDHPRIVVEVKSRTPAGMRIIIPSTAAGRYQILKRTFDHYKKNLGLSDFSPASQDTIALQLIRERGALPDINQGKISQAIAKSRTIWASLPGAGYGQPEKKMVELLAVYTAAGGVMDNN